MWLYILYFLLRLSILLTVEKGKYIICAIKNASYLFLYIWKMTWNSEECICDPQHGSHSVELILAQIVLLVKLLLA